MTQPRNAANRRWIKTAENRAAVIMLMTGVVAAALFLTALGSGYGGWATIAGLAAVVLIGGGFLSLIAGARRAGDPRPIHYHPDSPDVLYDVDRKTGKRTPHTT
ncbi:hypothetical protein [Rhodococcoides kyotonense]|uniref:Uncharacterized protein n=1 Tax=Rhodococcoides kyotonense TaxID=398843 RepID=A0A239JHT5_9NOCA|nr:hypothetical protein [Rhodococcus kyotonensis]SNT05471.1 hypothetical protein SAMN05421642_108242 [Rhodococcus kyotonensis]